MMPQITVDSLRSSVDMLRLFASQTGVPQSLSARIDDLEQRYFYMLRFIAAGNNVPDAAAELRSMAGTAREICTAIERVRQAKAGQTLYGTQLKYEALRPEENLQSLLSDYLSESGRLSTDAASLTDSRRSAALERLASDIFMRIWTVFPLGTDDSELLLSLFEGTDIPSYDSELWLGATGLGLTAYDDERRRELLLRVLRGGNEPLSAIAAVWLVVASVLHKDQGIAELNRYLADIEECNPGDVAAIFMELFRACGTKELSDDFARNILPDIMDIGRRMGEKFKNDPSRIEEAMRNGEWDDGIDVNGFDKIRSFMDAQNRGDDVYMATLGRMRQFPFFNAIANWFLPFHTGHSALADVTDGEGVAFAESVGKMPFLCDSDKYALLLSVAQTPAPMRDRLLGNIVDSQQAMNTEMLEAAMEEMQARGRKAVFGSYIKELYRFFTLFRRKGEFPVLFDIDSLFRAFPYKAESSGISDSLPAMAEALLNMRHYSQAARLFSYLGNTEPENVIYMQKAGYAHELAGHLMSATESYANALGLKEDVWTLRRMAAVLAKKKDYEAIDSFFEGKTDLFADDAETLGILATAAYRTGRYSRALELYYNVAYLDGGDAAKPVLAWLLVINRDLDAAEATFADFIDTSDKADDFLHYGHMFWAKGDVPSALAAYVRAAALVSPQKESFAEIFAESFKPLSSVLSPARLSALRTIPDIIAFRTYGSRFGKI